MSHLIDDAENAATIASGTLHVLSATLLPDRVSPPQLAPQQNTVQQPSDIDFPPPQSAPPAAHSEESSSPLSAGSQPQKPTPPKEGSETPPSPSAHSRLPHTAPHHVHDEASTPPRFPTGLPSPQSALLEADAPLPPFNGLSQALQGFYAPPPNFEQIESVASPAAANSVDDCDPVVVDRGNSNRSGADDEPEISASAEGEAKRRECMPKPFARRLRIHMDACAGTNKSQYCFGGFALLVSLGILDVVWISFMLQGHTKFASDLVARAIAGVFNGSDVFNIGMLVECAQRCSSVQLYDVDTMYHWKEATKLLFGAVDNVMSYRQFFILPEHDLVDVGGSVPHPVDMEPFPGRTALLRSDEALQAAAMSLYARSLKKIALDCLDNNYKTGVGAGALDDGSPRLQPRSVVSFLRERLFMRLNESEPVWSEQLNWMHPDISLDTFNESLQRLRPYSEGPEHGRDHYGKKLSSIIEQYS